MMGKMQIIKAGMYTTIQDKGRFGFSKYGLPKSGGMDQESLVWANMILGNHENDAVLEWTMIPPVLKFDVPTYISVIGENVVPFLNNEEQPCYAKIRVVSGAVLRIENRSNIVYGYIGIEKGFQSENIFGSRSLYKGITTCNVLSKKDEINYFYSCEKSHKHAKIIPRAHATVIDILTVYEGVEFSKLTVSQQKKIVEHTFTIAPIRNRMGIQLVEKLEHTLKAIITSPVLPGTVQVTPSGQLIVLMRDCQTTGGYPRVLQLSEGAINRIAQRQIGNKIQFQIEKL